MQIEFEFECYNRGIPWPRTILGLLSLFIAASLLVAWPLTIQEPSQLVYKTRLIPPHNTPDYYWVTIHHGRLSLGYLRSPELAPGYQQALRNWRHGLANTERDLQKLFDQEDQSGVKLDQDIYERQRDLVPQAQDSVRSFAHTVEVFATPGVSFELAPYLSNNGESMLYEAHPVGAFAAEVHHTSTDRLFRIVVPLWALALALILSSGLMLLRPIRAALRRRRGLCPNCGYDLRATPQKCPECGHALPATS